MHICMIASEFPPILGGVGYYVYNLSKTLLARGHKITVITRAQSSCELKREVVEGIEVFRVPFFPVYPFHVFLSAFFINKRFKSLEREFTLIHSHTPMPLPVVTSLPIMATVHTPMKVDARYHEIFNLYSLSEKAQSMVAYPFMESKLLRASAKITAVSRSVANDLREYGLDRDKIAIVGNGVDEKTFTPLQNRNCTEKYVLYTGVLRARKGLFDFLKCAKHVSKEYPEVQFAICGSGPFLHELKGHVQRMGLQKNVKFLGHVTRKRLVEVYQKATVHVVPSHYEGLPTVLLEAMSCGLPVVATDIGGNDEVLVSGVNGLLVPPKCPEEMANAVLELLADPLLREKIGRAARKTIEERYTWDKIADNILTCYENMLAAPFEVRD